MKTPAEHAARPPIRAVLVWCIAVMPLIFDGYALAIPEASLLQAPDGSLHINTSSNRSVFINGVDVLAEARMSGFRIPTTLFFRRYDDPPAPSADYKYGSHPAVPFFEVPQVSVSVAEPAVARGEVAVTLAMQWHHNNAGDVKVNMVLLVSKDNGTSWPPVEPGFSGALPAVLASPNTVFCSMTAVESANGGSDGTLVGSFPIDAGDVLRFRVLLRYEQQAGETATDLVPALSLTSSLTFAREHGSEHVDIPCTISCTCP